MPQLVQTDTSPYGLSGGTIITGVVNQQADAFCFYPVDDCANVIIDIENMNNSPLNMVQLLAGLPVYGAITNVQMSSGTAILYSGSYHYPQP
jgi:hypothetical protein